MISWDEFIKRALYIYTHRDQYTYCLGAAGEPVESERVRNLFEWYYENGYKDIIGMPYDQWVRLHAGKRCFDCSGYLDYCLTNEEGYHLYSSWHYGEMPKASSLVAGVAGSALWKRGHVGLDFGYGHFLHFPNWNRTCEEGKISEYDWTSSHQVIGVDYNGADNR